MTVIVVGDDRYANLAGDTGMVAFGPLHQNYKAGMSAKEEMETFRDALFDDLGVDPRNLTDESLRELYANATVSDDMTFSDLEAAKESVETRR